MNTLHYYRKQLLTVLLLVFTGIALVAQEDYQLYDGKILDQETNKPLVFATITLMNTNISTVSNSEGDFELKVPSAAATGTVIVSLLGYTSVQKPVSELGAEKLKIRLTPIVTQLSPVNIITYKNAEALVRAVFKDKARNNFDDAVVMTAFYRETIKRRKRNVSLTEAVVNLYKEPVSSDKKDVVSLHKARKSTDYKRLDTVALKLQGGPFSALYVDVMKYPEYIFNDRSIGYYNFSYGTSSTVKGRPVYVVNFVQKEEIPTPGYQGKLYIDAETLALTSATYSLVIDDPKQASKLFVRKKPRDVNAYPTQASYRVDYRERNGKWYYGYGSVQLSFKVDKRRRLFNSVYTLSSEMAVTDWEMNTKGRKAISKQVLRPTVIIADAVSGFADPDFWGPYNVIEPEKSIESAINKIRKKLARSKK